MMPGPPPVITASLCLASSQAIRWAVLYSGAVRDVRAEPKIVTAGPVWERTSKDSTNSDMIRKMRHGSSRMNSDDAW